MCVYICVCVQSFHLFWADYVFEDQHQAMKHFVRDAVIPAVHRSEGLSWTRVKSDGSTVDVPCVDPAPYAKTQALSLTWSGKARGGDGLYRRPWNISQWCEMELPDLASKKLFFEQTLVSVRPDESNSRLIRMVFVNTHARAHARTHAHTHASTHPHTHTRTHAVTQLRK